MKRVLIIGDSEFISNMLKRLSSNEIDILSVPSVEEAMKVLTKNDINIVVLNLKSSLENMKKIADKIQAKYNISTIIFESVHEPSFEHINLDFDLLNEEFKRDNMRRSNYNSKRKYKVKHKVKRNKN